jgi:hypothetical protein
MHQITGRNAGHGQVLPEEQQDGDSTRPLVLIILASFQSPIVDDMSMWFAVPQIC